jgi:uncharacterized YigZ family protein
METYVTITEKSSAEYSEKRSRFIAIASPCTSEAEAQSILASLKSEYWDARHNCSAYVIGENNEIMHSSDDGEPSGTAGRPMLSVLTGADLHNVAVVVTRYFGGVLLGTGGLVRAYQGAVSAAIANCQIEEQIDLQLLDVTVEYGDIGKIQYFMEQKQDYRLEDTEYGVKVVFHIAVPVELTDKAKDELVQLTGGKAEIVAGDIVASV